MEIMKAEEKRKQLIYELMTGLYDLEQVQFPESKLVENEYEDGKPCSELYGRVYDANVRLCERLGVEEDTDVNIIRLRSFRRSPRWACGTAAPQCQIPGDTAFFRRSASPDSRRP